MGFDLVRNEFGGWRVLEDNVRNPSGAAYAIAIRDLMDEVLPDLPRPDGSAGPGRRAAGAARLPARARRPGRARGAAVQRPGQRRPGSSTSCWPSAAGCCWSPPTTSRCGDGGSGTAAPASGSTRSTCGWTTSWSTSTDSAGRPIGAEVFDVAAAGEVVLANAPGNGVADDKAMYCYVPELIAYYLHERPLLESVPTYRTSDETERRIVLERVGELVTKPVDGHGGHRGADRPGRRRPPRSAERRAEIAANPAGWVAQEVVALSSHPTSRRQLAAAPARRPARLRLPARHRGRGLYAGRPGPDPGRTGGQPGGQLLPRRRRQGHLDHRRADGAVTQPDSKPEMRQLIVSDSRGELRFDGAVRPTSSAVRAGSTGRPGPARPGRLRASGPTGRSPSATGGCRSST